jgi:hypothetical protein
MADLIATIFHITDMHLLVDRDDEMREDKLRRARPFAGVLGAAVW